MSDREARLWDGEMRFYVEGGNATVALREAERILAETEPGHDVTKAFGAYDPKASMSDVAHWPVTYRAVDQTLTEDFAALAESLARFVGES